MRIDLHVNMYEPTNDLPDLTMIIWSTQGWHKSTNKQSYSYNISTITKPETCLPTQLSGFQCTAVISVCKV